VSINKQHTTLWPVIWRKISGQAGHITDWAFSLMNKTKKGGMTSGTSGEKTSVWRFL
jgi:hypothetical protein